MVMGEVRGQLKDLSIHDTVKYHDTCYNNNNNVKNAKKDRIYTRTICKKQTNVLCVFLIFFFFLLYYGDL